MLATDPRTLKFTDRLKSLLIGLPGVESVAFSLGEALPGTATYGQTVGVANYNGTQAVGPVLMQNRPMAATFPASIDGPEGKELIAALVAKFRALVAGDDPAAARPQPHVDFPGTVYFPVAIDGFPVRVIASWSPTQASHVITLDTLLPAPSDPSPASNKGF